ncbi:MAG TPA: M15 family metallopeptidase [Steroidobacteraceae bacterium]
MFNSLELTGRASTHVCKVPKLSCTVHCGAVAELLAMHAAAREAGIELAVVSSFRDFERQLAIWNAKFEGTRELFDRDSRPLRHASLGEPELIEAILTWSALPGASRHHWGTDIDVIDRAAVGADYQVQLLPAEFRGAGPFARLDAWLAGNMSRFGFFRPYASARDGVQPEPWHLSFAPLAVPALDALTLEVLQAAVSGAPIFGREALCARLPEIYSRYVLDVDPPGS